KLFDIFSKMNITVPVNMYDFIPFIVNTIFPLRTPLGNDTLERNISINKLAIPDYFDNEVQNRDAIHMTFNEPKLTDIKMTKQTDISNSDIFNLNLPESKARKFTID